jgi:hypothetical protein
MLTMWIIFGAAAAATLIWRVRAANATLDRILRDGGADSDSESLPATHDR